MTDNTSFCKILRSLEAARFVFKIVRSFWFWNLKALRQQCCRCAWQMLKRCDVLHYQPRGFETSRDLTIRRIIGYWNRALGPVLPLLQYDAADRLLSNGNAVFIETCAAVGWTDRRKEASMSPIPCIRFHTYSTSKLWLEHIHDMHVSASGKCRRDHMLCINVYSFCFH